MERCVRMLVTALSDCRLYIYLGMSQLHFISFAGGDSFKDSSKRLQKEAQKLHIFKSIKIYHDEDLPPQVRFSPLSLFKRGHGYWVWKPWIIYNTLTSIPCGDIVVYADCGCTLHDNREEWYRYKTMLYNTDAIFFQYRRDVAYNWGSSDNSFYCKKEVIRYFSLNESIDWLHGPQLWSGLIIAKRTENAICLIDDWLRITLCHPEFIIDVCGPELEKQDSCLIEHRHDQAILSALIYTQKKAKCMIVPETSEPSQHYTNPIVSATRIRKSPPLLQPSFSTKITNRIKKFIGQETYDKLHFWGRKNSLL